jgi:hypothetical protein
MSNMLSEDRSREECTRLSADTALCLVQEHRPEVEKICLLSLKRQFDGIHGK